MKTKFFLLVIAAMLALIPEISSAQFAIFSKSVVLNITDSTATIHGAYEYQITEDESKVYFLSVNDFLYQTLKRGKDVELKVKGVLLNDANAEQLLLRYRQKLEGENMPELTIKQLVNRLNKRLTIRNGENCYIIASTD